MKAKQIKMSIFAVLLIAALLFTAIPITVNANQVYDNNPVSSTADETDISDFEYQFGGDSEIWIRQYIGNQKSITIPEYIDGFIVAGIDGVEYLVTDEVEEIYIPKTISHYIYAGMSESPCENSHLKSINVSDENKYLSSSDGVLYNKDKTSLICYPVQKEDTVFTIPKSVNGISCAYDFNEDELSFCGNKNVKKLYVYDNSYGLEWAKSHDFPYEIIEGTPVEKALVDKDTEIQASGVMDANATLNVESVKNSVENAISTFDITLVKDGNIIQPDGTITISIPSEYGDCDVFWIKDDGTKVNMNAEYVDSKYVFTTDHLSVYALVRNIVPTVPEPTETIPVPTETVPETTETDPVPTETVPEPTETDPITTESKTTEPTTTIPVTVTTNNLCNPIMITY